MAAAIGGTPLWVWLLLAYTIWAGLRAAQARALGPGAILVLPGVFLLLSAQPFLNETARASGAAPWWLLGLATGVAAGWVVGSRSGAWREGDLLRVPGSWTVLVVSLAVFAVQYWLGYLRATDPSALSQSPLSAVVPFASALGAGILAGRAGALLRRYGRVAPRAG